MSDGPVTIEQMRDAERDFRKAETADAVRRVFKFHYQTLGWKRLCKMFVLEYRADDLFLAERERAQKRGASE